MAPTRGPKTFKDAFANVLLNRTGIALSSAPHYEDDLSRSLEMTLRQDGLAGDAATVNKAESLKRAVATLPAKVHSTPVAEDPDRWSDDAKELTSIVEKLGPLDPNITSEAFIKPFFSNLRLQNMSISELDEDVMKFTKLVSLDVSQSPLRTLANLPPSLKFLKAYNTQVTRITCKPTPTLCFLGLGHCPFAEQGLSDAVRRFPNLLSMDLGFTRLRSMPDVLQALRILGRPEDGVGPRQLYMLGTPLSLLPFYRLEMLASGPPSLQLLDGVPVSDSELADAATFQPTLAAERPSLDSMKVGVRLSAVSGLRGLLSQVADSWFAEKQQAYAAAKAAAAEAFALAQEQDPDAEAPPEPTPPEVEVEGKDWIFESCLNGSFRLGFGLPQEVMLETGEIFCPQPTEKDKSGKEIPSAVIDPNIFDHFDLNAARDAAGNLLNGEIQLRDVGLTQLCDWLRDGFPVKLHFRRAIPPDPAEEAEAEKGKGAKGKADAKAKAKSEPKLRQPSKDKDRASSKQGSRSNSRQESRASDCSDAVVERPPEATIGAGKIILDGFLQRTTLDVTDAMRQSPESLPTLPAPWKMEADGRILPIQKQLEAQTQVPQSQTKEMPQSCASLALTVVLYVDEEQEERERLLAQEQELAAQQPVKKGKK